MLIGVVISVTLMELLISPYRIILQIVPVSPSLCFDSKCPTEKTNSIPQDFLVLLLGAVEYTDDISAVVKIPPPRSVLDKTSNHLITRLQPGDLGNVEYPFMSLHPGPLCSGVVTYDRLLPMFQIELFDI